MLEDIVRGVFLIFEPTLLLLIVAGVLFGIVIGITPGLGGLVALAILLPLTYYLEGNVALILLVAAHSVCATGGSVTAVLMGIPGTEINAATLLDGYPMTRRGQAGRGIGIALTASAVGGVFGAIVLAALIPVVRPIVMAFGSPESLMLVVIALSFLAVLSGHSMLRGMIAGLLGLFISLIGYHAFTGLGRFTFGITYLYDGIPIVPAALGLFGVPSALELIASGKAVSRVTVASTRLSDIWQGIREVFQHWWLTLRGSGIGAGIGIIPGIGGATAMWVAYGHAKMSSRHPEEFGYGCGEGIIGPESANNSKEGGALLTTLAFGIPGSAAMAMLMGALLIHGIVVGPLFLKHNLDLAFGLVSTLVFANVLGALILLALGKYLVRITFLPGHILGPFVLALITLGAYSLRGSLIDVLLTFIIGGMGLAMVRLDYSRPALFVGYILGAMAERYFLLSVDMHGVLFFTRPLTLGLLAVVILAFTHRHLTALFRAAFKRGGA